MEKETVWKVENRCLKLFPTTEYQSVKYRKENIFV